MDWLDYHLQNFVKPYLGEIPKIDYKNYHIVQFNRRQLIALGGVWTEAKRLAKGRPILLAGRDVFLFEVLAGLEGFDNTIFRPDISSLTKDHKTLKGIYDHCYCIDTGCKGSVPKALGISDFHLIYFSGFEYPVDKAKLAQHQIFPNRKNPHAVGPIMSLYNLLEGHDKYWYRADYDDRKRDIVQPMSDKATFAKAAMVTMHVGEFFRDRYGSRQHNYVPMPLGRFV